MVCNMTRSNARQIKNILTTPAEVVWLSVRYVEHPEVEGILEELETKYKFEGDVYLSSYDKEDPGALQLEHVVDGYVVDPKVTFSMKMELIFRIFLRMSGRD